MAAAHRTAVAFVRRAGLIAAVLAIIVGIFGMHVLTGTHGMHSPVSAAGASAAHGHGASGGDHKGHQSGSGTMPGPGISGGQDIRATAEQCSDSGACSSMQAMTAACTPSSKTATMAAPPPGSLVLGVRDNTLAGHDAGLWTYLPGSPSPCELSISRT